MTEKKRYFSKKFNIFPNNFVYCKNSMYKFFVFLFFIFLNFQNPCFAEDISDFEIERISVGDSLLDYFSRNEIINEMVFEVEQENNKEIAHFYSYDNYNDYYALKFAFKTKDSDFRIIALVGFVDINFDIKICYQKKDQIINEIEKLFINVEIITDEKREHDFDPSSTIEGTIFKFPTKSRYFSFIRVQCYDWSKKSGYDDQLRIEITSKEYYEWLFELHESLNK